MAKDNFRERLLGGTALLGNPFTPPVVEPQPSLLRRSKALKPGERGLVMTPPFKVVDTTISGRPIDPQHLRSSLLFWDYLESPTSLASFELSPDEEFLQAEGLLFRSLVRRSVWRGKDAYQDFLFTFAELDKQDPGRWSLARLTDAPDAAESAKISARGALITLYNAIPVPDRDVPLEDVLRYRQDRRAELLALRHHLESLAQDIAAAPDRDLALSTELSKLDAAIADHVKASRESRLKLKLSDLTAGVNLLPIATTVVASHAGLPLSQALLLGAGALKAELTIGASLKRKKERSTPYEYVSRFHDL